MTSRAVAAALAALLSVSVLAGCSDGDTPTPTVTVTATVTVAAAPEPSAGGASAADVLTPLEAWKYCWNAMASDLDEGAGDVYVPDSVTDLGDESFEVRVPVSASAGHGDGADAICVVSQSTSKDVTIDIQGFDDAD